MDFALSDILVIDLTRLQPGPFCSMLLSDNGARVIHIEHPGTADAGIPEIRYLNRNKEHMALDLKTEKGRRVFLGLAEKADVVMEGFRPQTAKRLGVDYDTLAKINPNLVYASITGYGQTGPFARYAGHDLNFQSLSGALSLIGERNGPPALPMIQLGDMSGAMYGAFSILLALLARKRTGKGQYIDVSMTHCLTSFLTIASGRYLETGEMAEKGNDLYSGKYPCYTVYAAKDGKFMAVAALEEKFWAGICTYFKVPEYIPLQYDKDSIQDIHDFLAARFLEKTRDEWTEIFLEKDLCVTPVHTLDEVIGENGIFRKDLVSAISTSEGEMFRSVGFPVGLSRTPASVRTPPPGFGQDTQKIMQELGAELEDETSGRK